MPDRAAKKHRKNLQRKAKSREHRKIAAAGPWKAIAAGTGELEVWWNSNWKETRQASILVIRRLRTGTVLGSMLVDLGMAGLKDAWDRPNIPSDEMRLMFDACADAGIPLVRCDPDDAMRLVRGAIRFAGDNGFRLPRHYERVVSILGPLGDWRTADVSDFYMEYVGSPDDLRRRLVGQSLEDFLARRDVEIVLDDDAPSLLRDEEQFQQLNEEESISDAFNEIREKAIQSINEWCVINSEIPSPMLGRAVELFFTSMAAAAIRGEHGTLLEDDAPDAAPDLTPGDQAIGEELFVEINAAILKERESDREQLREAIKQFARVASNRSREEFISMMLSSE